jgi:hypothetical protein
MTNRLGLLRACAVLAVLIALAGCGTQHAGQLASAVKPAGVSASTAGSPRQRAEADAARIIASFRPPPGAVRSARAPSPLLSGPPEIPGTPDLVTRTQWWTAPGQPVAVLAWMRAHVRSGLRPSGSGSAGHNSPGYIKPGKMPPRPRPTVQYPDIWFDTFSLPVVPNVLTERSLLITVVRHSSKQTAIRVDAQVIWLPAKQAAERIPADARVVTVTPVFGLQPGSSRERLDPAFTVTDPAKVARIASAVDGLPVFPPGDFSCPADTGAQLRLTFRTSRHGPVVAQVTADYDGCRTVSVTINGAEMPALSDMVGSLPAKVLAIAGVRWPYSPGTLPT